MFDELTYTVVYTNPGVSPALNAVLTDMLPNSGLTKYIIGSASGAVYDSNTHTLTWNLGTIPPGASVTLTYRLQVTPKAVNKDVLTNTVTLTHSNGILSASASTRIVGRYDVVLAIYNEAGELVSVLAHFDMTRPINNFDMSQTSIRKEGEVINFVYDGQIIGTWDGTNVDGQLVSGGQYYVKVDSTDVFNVTTSVTQTVSVSFEPWILEIAVYNEAGERVRVFDTEEIEQYLAASGRSLSQKDYQVGGTKVSPLVIQPSRTDPLGDGNAVRIVLASGAVIYWDGRNERGEIVTTGQYYIQLTSLVPGKVEQIRTIPVAVMAPEAETHFVRVSPNPLDLKKNTILTFRLNTTGMIFDNVQVKIYAVSGELIHRLQSDSSNPAVVQWNLGMDSRRLANGVYLAVVEARSGSAIVGREVVKVLVLR